MRRELRSLIELAGLSPEEEARLRRVHELLVAAGPPAELPGALLAAPSAPAPVSAAGPPRRRASRRALLLAAAVAAVCFGCGYVLANQAHSDAMHLVQVVSLQGAEQNSFASLRVGSADGNGNWPLQLTVRGLPRLAGARARYVLMLWENGRPAALCGTFKVGGAGPTTVSFSVPYPITKATRWVVTEMAAGAQFPGQVVMTSS